MWRRALLLSLASLATLMALPFATQAALWTTSVSGQWECRSSGIDCIDDSGYTGTSVWGYPVDSQGNNCTNYAAYRLDKNGAKYPGNFGNAMYWAVNARAKGIPVNGTAAVGAIAQWDKGSGLTRVLGRLDRGHVAYVEAVNGSTILLSDSNYQYGSKRWTVSKGDVKWPSNFIHFKDKPAAPDPKASLRKYIGHIVQWSGDKKAQKTAWLVGPDLRRRWIPDIATYNCLKSKGAPGPDVLPASTLDKLKDLTGVRATCTPPSSVAAQPPPDSKAPAPTTSPPKHIFHVHNTCADNSCGLLVETAPGSRFGGKVIGTLKDGTAINIRCQTVGGMITGGEGSNDVWDQIDFGGGVGYVADLYVDTPGDVKAGTHRYYTSSIPRC